MPRLSSSDRRLVSKREVRSDSHPRICRTAHHRQFDGIKADAELGKECWRFLPWDGDYSVGVREVSSFRSPKLPRCSGDLFDEMFDLMGTVAALLASRLRGCALSRCRVEETEQDPDGDAQVYDTTNFIAKERVTIISMSGGIHVLVYMREGWLWSRKLLEHCSDCPVSVAVGSRSSPTGPSHPRRYPSRWRCSRPFERSADQVRPKTD